MLTFIQYLVLPNSCITAYILSLSVVGGIHAIRKDFWAVENPSHSPSSSGSFFSDSWLILSFFLIFILAALLVCLIFPYLICLLPWFIYIFNFHAALPQKLGSELLWLLFRFSTSSTLFSSQVLLNTPFNTHQHSSTTTRLGREFLLVSVLVGAVAPSFFHR